MRGRSTEGFTPRGTSFEPISPDLGIETTPVEDFFVCKGGGAPSIDPETWSVLIHGDGVRREARLSLQQLLALPQREVNAWLECAGNGRSLYELVGGTALSAEANQTPWMLSAMGMATWHGPPLRSVLEVAGVSDGAAWASPAGVDVPETEGEQVRMTLPIDKALHDDTIVALTMNGAPLQRMHGAPARLLVPGWVGAYSVKWLDRIEVSSRWVGSWRADVYYRRRLPDGTDLGPATSHPVKSSLALPWPARLRIGPTQIHGYARAAGSMIARVEWSVDGGPWHDAELFGPNETWTWSPFRFTWSAAAGHHTLRTRATDAAGENQPDAMPLHPNGILWNAVIPHPVEVI